MNLEELISTLTTAQEQSTEGVGEWTTMPDSCHVHAFGPATLSTVSCRTPEDAQAIATRHNTAALVLQELKQLAEMKVELTISRSAEESQQFWTQKYIDRSENLQAKLDSATSERDAVLKYTGIPTSELSAVHSWAKSDDNDNVADDLWGDPLEDAIARIKELLSMFDCQTCYDQGWVVGIEGADPGGGDPGNECQVACPDCLPKDRATKPRPIEGGKRGEVCDECGIDADVVTERLMQAQERNNKLTLELLKSGNAYAELAKGLLTDKPRPMSEAPQDGTPILIECEFGWSVGYRDPKRPTVWNLHGWHAVDWRDKYCLGWLPLPEDPTS